MVSSLTVGKQSRNLPQTNAHPPVINKTNQRSIHKVIQFQVEKKLLFHLILDTSHQSQHLKVIWGKYVLGRNGLKR